MLKKLSLGLLVLVFLVLTAFMYYFWRSLPQLDGELRLIGLRQSVEVFRDGADVTHIQAANPQDAYFALGFVHAQERTWQLSFNRRLMHGTLSEILGPATLETDQLMRSLDIKGAAQRQYQSLPKMAQEALQSYSAGINTFFEQTPQALPPEFHILVGSKPRHSEPMWSPQDSVGWALMMALDLGGNWGAEMARLSLLQVLDTSKLWQLMPPYPGEEPLSNTDLAALYHALQVYPETAVPASPPKAHLNLNQPLQRAWAAWSEHWISQVGETNGKGSNNWVVSGQRSSTGKPLLANDPHLSLSAPAIWYFAALKAPAGQASDGTTIAPLKVIGATLPGLPFVVLGRTDQVAWSATNTGPDVQDLYLERIDTQDSKRYQIPSGWQEFETRLETIRVKGQADVVFQARRTRHGPVISDALPSYAQVINLKRYALALRWSALDDDNHSVLGSLLANQAQDVNQLFTAFAHHHSPMQSVVAADTQGNIRMRAVGRVPLRHPDNDLRGLAPAPGWQQLYDWQGFIPYAENPQDLGEKGWIATANQRIVGPDYPHHLTQDWILPYRHNRIVNSLKITDKHDPDSMRALQADIYSAAMLKLWPHLLQVKSTHPMAADAMAELIGFDGLMRADRAAPLIGAVWIDELARGIIAPKIGSEKFATLYGKRDFRAGLEGILERNDPYWCGDSGCAAATQAALERALNRITTWQGPKVSAWQWGNAHRARSMHRPFDKIDALTPLFNVERPTGGDSYTVNVGQYYPSESEAPFANRQAASLRAIYDLADLERSQFIYQTGQSGLVFSGRYRDMATEWAQGQYRALQLDPPQWQHQLTLKP